MIISFERRSFEVLTMEAAAAGGDQAAAGRKITKGNSNAEPPKRSKPSTLGNAEDIPVESAGNEDQEKHDASMEARITLAVVDSMKGVIGHLSSKIDGVTGDVCKVVEQKLDEKLDAKLGNVQAEIEDKLTKEREDREVWQKNMRFDFLTMEQNIEKLNTDASQRMDNVEKKVGELSQNYPVKHGVAQGPLQEGEQLQLTRQQWTPLEQSPVLSKGIGKGKEWKRQEEMSRTLVVGQYAEGTLKADIIKHMSESLLMDTDGKNVEEVFAFGKKYAQRGGVRFVSTQEMWNYLTIRRGSHAHDFRGYKVFARPGFVFGEDEDKSRAVRKSMRALYETESRGTDYVKEEFSANYHSGIVRCKGVPVAKWSDATKTMEWTGMEKAAERFRELMSRE